MNINDFSPDEIEVVQVPQKKTTNINEIPDDEIEVVQKPPMTRERLNKLEEERAAAEPSNVAIEALKATGGAVKEVAKQAPGAVIGTAGMLAQFPTDVATGGAGVLTEGLKRAGIISPERAEGAQAEYEKMSKAVQSATQEAKDVADYSTGARTADEILAEEQARKEVPREEILGIPGAEKIVSGVQGLATMPFQPAITVGQLLGGGYREAVKGETSPELENIRKNAGQEIANVMLGGSMLKRMFNKPKAEAQKPTTELTPEEVEYAKKFDAELATVKEEAAPKPMQAETPTASQPAPLTVREEKPLTVPPEGMTIESKLKPQVTIGETERKGEALPEPKPTMTIESRRPIDELFVKPKTEKVVSSTYAPLSTKPVEVLNPGSENITYSKEPNISENSTPKDKILKSKVKLTPPPQKRGAIDKSFFQPDALLNTSEAEQIASSAEYNKKITREEFLEIKKHIKLFEDRINAGETGLEKSTQNLVEEVKKFIENKSKPINKLFQKGKEFLGNEEGSLKIGPITDSLKGGFKAARTKLYSAREKLAEFAKPLDYIFQFAFEKYAPAIKGVKKEARVAALEDVDQYRYADNLMKRFLKDSGLGESIAEDLTKAGLDIDDLGAYAKSRRILYERDPRNIQSQLTKAEAIAQMNEYNPKQRAAVQKVFEDIQREWQTSIVPKMAESEVFPPETIEYMKRNKDYSRDVGVDKAKEFVASGSSTDNKEIMAHLEGSKQETFNPVEQMVIHARALNQFQSHEVMKRKLVEKMADNGLVSDEPKLGYEPVEYAYKGEWVKKYVPKDMQRPLMETPVESWGVTKFMDWLVYGNPVSKWITTQIITNPSFVAANSMVVDPLTTWAQLPSFKSIYGYPIAHTLTILEAAGSTHAAKLAKAWGLKPLNEARADMAKRNIYNIGSLYDKATSGETQLGEMMDTLGLNQKALEFFKGKTNAVSKAYGAFKTQASKLDNTSKESLFRYLEAKEGWRGEAKINQMVREMGTPATKRGGTGEPIARRTTLFGNAILQATRATAKNFADNPAQFTLKNVGVPMALAYGMYKWIESDPEVKRKWDTLPDYQKRNFINIYTGKGTDGQPAFFTLPLPRFAKVAYGLMLDALENDKSFAEKAANVGFGLLGGAFSELPSSLAQPLALGYDVATYASGKSPYDKFRGQDVIPKEVMEADATLWNKLMGDDKMNDLSTTKAFGSYLLNTYGVGGWFKTDALKSIPEGYEWTKLPAINRFIRFGGSGVKSKLVEAKDEGAKLNARAALIIKDAVKKSLDKKTDIEMTPQLSEAITYLPRKITSELTKGILKQQSKETGDETIDLYTTLQGATPMQKMLIIQKFQKMFPDAK